MLKRSKVKVKVNTGTATIKRFMLHTLPNTILTVNKRFIKDVAEIAAVDVKARLWKQLYKHKPLAPSTVDYKKSKGLDKRILLATKRYHREIGVQSVPFPNGIGYRVGVPDRSKYPDGTPLSLVARVHENGTFSGSIPARPHYRPVLRSLQANINVLRRKHSRFLSKELKLKTEALRRKGIII